MAASANGGAWIERADADQCGPLRIGEPRSLGEHSADEVLACGHHAAHAEVSGGRRAIELVAGHMSFLDAHDIETLEPVRNHAEGLASNRDRADGRIAMLRRHGELVGELAGEGDAEQSRWHPSPA